MEYMIGQRVIFRDMIGRDTDHPEIVDVICMICTPEIGRGGSEIWIDNPARGYKHWIGEGNIKSLPNGQV